MLARLGHDSFVGSNHEEGQIDAADAGQHVFDEIPVARHIHEADL